MSIRKNKIETYDNLYMKTDNPSYDGSFYDIQKTQTFSYPSGIPEIGDILYK